MWRTVAGRRCAQRSSSSRVSSGPNTEPLARSAGASTLVRRGFAARAGGEGVDLRRKYRIKERDGTGLGHYDSAQFILL
jgi:hypothetical protein